MTRRRRTKQRFIKPKSKNRFRNFKAGVGVLGIIVIGIAVAFCVEFYIISFVTRTHPASTPRDTTQSSRMLTEHKQEIAVTLSVVPVKNDQGETQLSCKVTITNHYSGQLMFYTMRAKEPIIIGLTNKNGKVIDNATYTMRRPDLHMGMLRIAMLEANAPIVYDFIMDDGNGNPQVMSPGTYHVQAVFPFFGSSSAVTLPDLLRLPPQTLEIK